MIEERRVGDDIRAALQATSGLVLLQSVLEDRTAQAVLYLLNLLSSTQPDALAVANAYSQAFRELATAVANDALPQLSDAWQAYLVARIIDDSNLWSLQIERTRDSKQINPNLRKQAMRDLAILQHLFHLRAEQILQYTHELVGPAIPVLQDAWLPWRDLGSEQAEETARDRLARRFVEQDDWTEVGDALEQHWMHSGAGPLARYSVFRWQGSAEGLRGIEHPDPIQLQNLIGYQREQQLLTANIERFLAGSPGHDTLLYGAPGTGKSSTIKALVNRYADQGLRLVEVRKEYMRDLPQIVAQLRNRAPRYLIFIDDLSFEEHETEYKVLKILLEGTAEARPANVLISATTNRMNLIRENFSDRGKPTEDTNWRDTMDEKQSLVHRFGLRITFVSPDQERYLEIARGLAHQRGIEMSDEELSTRALQWERRHVGRSGRLARQFVDELEGR